MEDVQQSRRRGSAVLGALLIVVGAVLVAGELSGFSWGGIGWPIWVIGPGLVLLVLAFVLGGDVGIGLAVLGGLMTSTGLLLVYQDSTGAYASWAYAWALVAPGSIGLSLLIYGLVQGRPDLVEAGRAAATAGLGLFLGFAIFFELILHISGDRLGQLGAVGLPAALVVLGALIVLRGLFSGRKQSR